MVIPILKKIIKVALIQNQLLSLEIKIKLKEIKIKNFRGYAENTSISINELTVLIGRNDAGKSTVLEALDIYFNETNCDGSDCSVGSNSKVIEISCVFDDLPEKIIVDDEYATTLKSEYLLRADNFLEIVKKYDCNTNKPKLSVFAIANHPSDLNVDNVFSLNLLDLKKKAKDLRIPLDNVDQTIKARLREAIWASVPNLQCKRTEVALSKETAKDAWDQIQKYMPVYALFKSDRASTDQDAEAQDPMKIAIKEVISKNKNELDDLIKRIQTQLQAVADKTVEKLSEMDKALASQLTPHVKNKSWDSMFAVSLTGEDDISINKRGSGTRRLVLLNFFRAKAESDVGERNTEVIYAIEEPETSQHPNNQKMLLKAFEELVEKGRCQVLLTTHTPALARLVELKCLRLIDKTDGKPRVYDASDDDNNEMLNKICETLGVLPDNKIKVFFGVEGKHDINFLKNISNMLAQLECDIPDLIAEENSGKLVFIPLGGSNLELWLHRLAGFKLQEFYLTDRDNEPPTPAKYQSYLDEWNKRDNCKAWVTSKRELENYLHVSLLKKNYQDYAGTGEDFDNVPNLAAESVHKSESEKDWAELSNEKKKEKSSKIKKCINNDLVKQMTPELLTESDPEDDIRSWLREIGKVLKS